MENTPINIPKKDAPNPAHPISNPKEIHLPKKEEHGEQKSNVAVKVFAVIGLAGILALLSFGIVKFAPQTLTYITQAAVTLSSKFIPSNNVFSSPLALTSDKTSLNTGEAFALGWAEQKEKIGTYTIEYPCINGFHLEAPQENENITLTCDTQYSFESDVNTLDLTAISLQSPRVEVPITLEFTEDGSEEVTYSADIRIAVINPALEETDATPTPVASSSNTPTPTKTPAPVRVTPRVVVTPRPTVAYVPPSTPTQIVNGKSDFIIRILETGIMNKTTGVFTAKTEIKKTDKAAVRFEIQNIGTRKSGVYTFESVLPTKVARTFKSGNQMPLMPGDVVQFVLGFDQIQDTNILSFMIRVDPERYEDELKENNNVGYVSIEVKY